MKILEDWSIEQGYAQERGFSWLSSGCSRKILVVVRGNSPQVEDFVFRVRQTVESVVWREMIWVKSEELWQAKKLDLKFKGNSNACAVVLDFDGEPVGFLSCKSSRYELDIMLLEALRSGLETTGTKDSSHPLLSH